jgi:hypothetical protein
MPTIVSNSAYQYIDEYMNIIYNYKTTIHDYGITIVILLVLRKPTCILDVTIKTKQKDDLQNTFNDNLQLESGVVTELDT